jgi:membrane associated rhomboid family serine protease
MLIPIKHENMSARRWPVVTLALIAINVAVFLFTLSAIDDEAPQLGEVKTHILILAALHPELKMQAESQHLVDGFKQSHPEQWKQVQNPNHDVIDAYDAKLRMTENPSNLQEEMDSLNAQLVKLSSSSIIEQYAFIPAQPRPISYLTANFLHGGWLHLIGNMWFLWLAGFVLEDVWGRWLYSVFYLIAGAAALQFWAWSNPGSITPTLGASGAVAALMGAFLVRFPKMKIEMAWLFMFKLYRFKAAVLAAAALAFRRNLLRIAVGIGRRSGALGARWRISVWSAGGASDSAFRPGAKSESGDRGKGRLDERCGTRAGQRHDGTRTTGRSSDHSVELRNREAELAGRVEPAAPDSYTAK